MLARHDRVLSRSGTINGALLTPSYLLALLRELSHVLWGLKEMIEPKQVRKTKSTGILYQIQKRVQKSVLMLGTQDLLDFVTFPRGSGPPLKGCCFLFFVLFSVLSPHG